jgi:hypothetical protein
MCVADGTAIRYARTRTRNPRPKMAALGHDFRECGQVEWTLKGGKKVPP